MSTWDSKSKNTRLEIDRPGSDTPQSSRPIKDANHPLTDKKFEAWLQRIETKLTGKIKNAVPASKHEILKTLIALTENRSRERRKCIVH